MTFPRHDERKEAQPATGPMLERAAVILAVIWAAGVLVFAILSPPAGGTTFLTLAMTLLVVLLPLALIWLALTTLRTLRELRAETAALQAMVEALRDPGDAGSHGTARATQDHPAPPREAAAGPASRPAAPGRAATGRPGDHPAPATAAARARPAAPPPRAAAPARPPSPAADSGQETREADPHDEPALALDAPDERRPEPLSAEEFIRALQFPDSAEDAEGVRALRLALEDRELARLIRAAQDVLTLLSQEGVYMDDLAPEPAPAGQWRLFAAGVRGNAVASVGGIRDHAPLALTGTRMREDAIFRDAAHHFLRAFDRSFQAFEKSASDAEILDLARTRTARAFMLFGRVAGVFD